LKDNKLTQNHVFPLYIGINEYFIFYGSEMNILFELHIKFYKNKC